MTRQTVSDAVVYTNRPDDQYPIAFDMPLPAYPEIKSLSIAEAAATGLGPEDRCSTMTWARKSSQWQTIPGVAIKAAINRIKEIERHNELTTG